MARTALGPLLLAVAASACHAQTRADAAANESGDISEASPATPRGRLALGPLPAASTAASRTAFIGVTTSVSLATGSSSTPVCHCLAAALGPPTSPAFAWQGPAPIVDNDALVVAIGGESTPCDVPTQGHGPSIQGVTQHEGDIIVTLEQWRPGIPLARGAIVPRPAPGRAVVFQPAGRLPFASATADKPICRLVP